METTRSANSLLLFFYQRLYYVLKQLPSVDDHVVQTIKKTTKIYVKFELTQPNRWKKNTN